MQRPMSLKTPQSKLSKKGWETNRASLNLPGTSRSKVVIQPVVGNDHLFTGGAESPSAIVDALRSVGVGKPLRDIGR